MTAAAVCTDAALLQEEEEECPPKMRRPIESTEAKDVRFTNALVDSNSCVLLVGAVSGVDERRLPRGTASMGNVMPKDTPDLMAGAVEHPLVGRLSVRSAFRE